MSAPANFHARPSVPNPSSLLYAKATIALGSLLLVTAFWAIVQERVSFEYDQSVADVDRRNTNLALLVETATRATLQDVDQALRFVRHEYAEQRASMSLARDLQEVNLGARIIKSLLILDARGNVVQAHGPAAAESGSGRAYLRRLAGDDADFLYVGESRPGEAGGWVMDMARRIVNTDGSFGGTVVATVDVADLVKPQGIASLGDHDMVALIGRDGLARVRRSGKSITFGDDFRGTAAHIQASAHPSGKYSAESAIDGVAREVAYRMMPDLPLTVVVGTEKREAFASYRGHRRSYIAVACIATLAVLALGAVLMRALSRQRRYLEALMSNESRLRATFEQAFVGMAQSEADGRLTRVNRTLCEITGYPERELLGRSLRDIVHADDRGAEGGSVSEVPAEKRLVRKDGSIAWTNIATTPVLDDAGGSDCLVTVVQDITEFKRIDRMKSEFVSIVSHELRTPLTSIRGSLGLVAGGVAGVLPDAAKNLVAIAKNNCERLIRLINDILDTEKIESGKMTLDMRELDLGALVAAAIESNEGFAAQHRVTLRLVAPQESLRVRADADRLTQVLTNLISNAVKFSPAEGQVEIEVARRGERLRVEVRDHGQGIPAEFHDRIFQKFSQADSSDTRQKGGTGLGLNISKAIVERLGGEIGFESAAGAGTTFHFELPGVTTASAAVLPPVGVRPRILVCEDDVDIARLIGMMLDKAGYDTDLVHTAAQARRNAAARRYAAITVDLHLPDEHGISLIRTLRRDPGTHDLPVIVISALAEEGRIRLNGEDLPVADWLVKPIDENRLVLAVRGAVADGADGRPRILHVEDDPDIQRVAAAIAQDSAAFEFADGLQEARALLRRWRFDLVLLDLQLPDGSGWELLADIEALRPRPPVVVFSVHDVDRRQRERVAAVLLKSDTSNEKLLETIRRVLGRLPPMHARN